MFDSASLIALLKVAIAFSSVIIGIRFKLSLWISIFAATITMGLLFHLSPVLIAKSIVTAGISPDFLRISAIVISILLLSALQGHSGQSSRLASGLEAHMKSTKLRLIFFPALIGLLPMPGGAIFSCPMVRDTARNTNLDPTQKSIINYWFRHIWETSWPLYPGYLLACGVSGVPISVLWRFTLPVVLISLVIGYIFFLRQDISLKSTAEFNLKEKIPLKIVLKDALALAVAIVGAPILSVLTSIFDLEVRTEYLFLIALWSAIAVIFWQSKEPLSVLPKLFFQKSILRMVLILFAIFSFKEVILVGGVVNAFDSLVQSHFSLITFVILLSFVAGLLTGVMSGYVGTALPIIVGLIATLGLQDELLLILMISLFSATAGMMLSPLHVCLLVTVDFFNSSFIKTWKKIALPSLVHLALSIFYALLIYKLGFKV